MSLDRAPADRLSDHLDAVVSGWDRPSHGLDPSLMTTVERFFAADDTPGPPPGLADQLWRDLLRQTNLPGVVPPSRVLQPDHNALPTPRPAPSPLPRRGLAHPGWSLAHLATAALVLLALALSFMALRGPQRLLGEKEGAISISAPDDALESTTLAEGVVTSWPASGPPFWASIHRITLDPGTVEELGAANTTGNGPSLFTVESGQVTVDADGPVVVTRGPGTRNAAPTTVTAETTIVLEAGDQIFALSEVMVRRRNDAMTPASILELRIADLEQVHRSGRARYERIMPDKVLNRPPPAPAEVALRRLRLMPGRSLPIDALPGLQMLYVEEGALDLMGARGLGDLAPVSWNSISAGSGLAHFETTRDLANRSTEPVTFLVATIDAME